MICEIMTDDDVGENSNVKKIAKIYKLLNKNQEKCNNVTYEEMVNDLRNETIDSNKAGKF